MKTEFGGTLSVMKDKRRTETLKRGSRCSQGLNPDLLIYIKNCAIIIKSIRKELKKHRY